ncbi:hypothetical protein YC2023_039481 [Brassica napus]
MGGKRESYGLMNTRTVDEEKSGRRKSSLEKGESWSKLLTVPGLTEFVRPLCMSTGLVVLFQSSRHQSLRQDIGFSNRKITLSPCVKQNNKKSNQSNIPNKIITIPTLTSLCFEANFFFRCSCLRTGKNLDR